MLLNTRNMELEIAMRLLLARTIKVLILVIGGALFLAAVGVVAAIINLELTRQQIAEKRRIQSQNGVDASETVLIGGIPQFINIRGRDSQNPILLYLHGGPGTPMQPIAHAFQDRWEEHFTVVQWDQRGAGKTYLLTPPEQVADTMSFERMTSDVLEMTDYLRTRFGQDRIVLLGHSWGSMIGLAAAMSRPEFYLAYVGTGQAIHSLESERLGYAQTLMRARQIGLQQAVSELEALAPYPRSEDLLDKLGTRHHWNAWFGEGIFGYQSLASALIAKALTSPDYGWRELWTLIAQDNAPYRKLDPVLVGFDALKWGTDWSVPVVFIEGRHDWQVNHRLVRDYYEAICAPFKAFIYLDEAAHAPMVEQPDLFVNALIEHVLPLTRSGALQAGSREVVVDSQAHDGVRGTVGVQLARPCRYSS